LKIIPSLISYYLEIKQREPKAAAFRAHSWEGLFLHPISDGKNEHSPNSKLYSSIFTRAEFTVL